MERIYITILSSGFVYASGKIPPHLRSELEASAILNRINLENPDPRSLLDQIQVILNGTSFERSSISLSVETPSGTRVWEGTWKLTYQEYLR
jgi:hypothetical protein